MQKAYYIAGSGLYAGEPFSYLWPFSQAFAATVSMALIPHMGINWSRELHARLVGLNGYLDNNNSGTPDGTFASTLPAFDGTVAQKCRRGLEGSRPTTRSRDLSPRQHRRSTMGKAVKAVKAVSPARSAPKIIGCSSGCHPAGEPHRRPHLADAWS
jgi:hypothetical protein